MLGAFPSFFLFIWKILTNINLLYSPTVCDMVNKNALNQKPTIKSRENREQIPLPLAIRRKSRENIFRNVQEKPSKSRNGLCSKPSYVPFSVWRERVRHLVGSSPLEWTRLRVWRHWVSEERKESSLSAAVIWDAAAVSDTGSCRLGPKFFFFVFFLRFPDRTRN